MRNAKLVLLLMTASLLLGCNQADSEFRLALYWGTYDNNDIITADDLVRADSKMRLALTKSNDDLRIEPIKEVTKTATFEYYQIPPDYRTEHDEKVNFGFVWVKPLDSDKGDWTNIQLWVKSSALTEGKNLCHNIGSDDPWTFYLTDSVCGTRVFDICDNDTPKLGLMYDQHYDIVLLSSTAEDVLNKCDP